MYSDRHLYIYSLYFVAMCADAFVQSWPACRVSATKSFRIIVLNIK